MERDAFRGSESRSDSKKRLEWPRSLDTMTREQLFLHFRDGVLQALACSRKVAALPAERRRELGSLFFAARDREDFVQKSITARTCAGQHDTTANTRAARRGKGGGPPPRWTAGGVFQHCLKWHMACCGVDREEKPASLSDLLRTG